MKQFMLFLSGLLFSMGLFISGMTNPAKVIGFLDITGAWDPSLMFVMLGAILPTFLLYRISFSRGSPVFSDRFDLPEKTDIDRRLMIGSAIFGVGWGLSGICPGPGVANLVVGHFGFLIFVASMLVGMLLGEKK